MQKINVTEFRNHLPKYLEQVNQGVEILITSHGHTIARILPPADIKEMAKKKLNNLRKKCKVLDVISSIDEEWDAEK